MQTNLEQIRALHAHRFWDQNWPDPVTSSRRLKEVTGADGGNVIPKLGPLLLECGLLSTLAFANHKGGGYLTLLTEVGRYLGSQGADGRQLLPQPATSLDAFVRQLTQGNSQLLIQATSEALIYLGYLKRFAPPPPTVTA